MENTLGQMAHFMREISMRTSKLGNSTCTVCYLDCFHCSYGFVLHRLEGQGTFTDVRSQVWYGNFTHKAAPGLKFKLGM